MASKGALFIVPLLREPLHRRATYRQWDSCPLKVPHNRGAIVALDALLPERSPDQSDTKLLIWKSTGHCTLLWARLAVCGLLLCNLVLLSAKVVSTRFLLAVIVVSKAACL